MTEINLISIVVPVYNEEGNLIKLHQTISKAVKELWYEFEIIFVDDGSQDRTGEVVRQLRDKDLRVKYLRLSRNFGTQMAIFAGLEHSRGAAAVVMDGDLQHPPALIPQMIARWKEGFEVVYAVREDTEDAGLLKRLTASAFARLFNCLVDTKIDPKACDFRLMDRTVVNQLVQMRERNRFFRSLVSWIGFRQTGIPYVAGRRHSGRTKYRFRKLLSLALDAITSFSAVPLRLCTYLGFVVAAACIPYALWAVYVRLFTDIYVPGWPAIIVAILALGAMQLICLGILGEYVGRIYQEVKGRPLYIIRERWGIDADTPHPASAAAATLVGQDGYRENG